jgi:ABC-type branched-subunit amino acid transport system substrate-binding protein
VTHPLSRILTGCLAALLLPFAVPAFCADLSPLERAGRRVYLEGSGSGPEIMALVGDETKVPASVVPCASCHGPDGRGRAEGGVIPSDITPGALSAPAIVTTPTGRKHGPYNSRLLKRAITQGFDSAGNRLTPIMPRYQMAMKDVDALLAYLGRLDDEEGSGVTPERVRVGILLPPARELGEVANEVSAILRAYADQRNAEGGVYGRKLALLFCQPEGTPAARAETAREFITREQPFALISSFTDGADAELTALAEREQIPLLATLSSRTRSSVATSRYVRELLAGIPEQSRALAKFVAIRTPRAHTAILHTSDGSSIVAADAAAGVLRKAGSDGRLFDDSIAPHALEERGIDTVIFLGSPDALASLLSASRAAEWQATVLVPSALLNPAALQNGGLLPAHLYISLPTGPADQNTAALEAYSRLAAGSHVARKHVTAQFAALASAQLFMAALERAGRELTRRKLLDTIDGIRALDTGLVPPLTFNANRHIGSTGSYIAAIGASAEQDGEIVWIDPG